jgi:hypothetical protein
VVGGTLKRHSRIDKEARRPAARVISGASRKYTAAIAHVPLMSVKILNASNLG